ncbi:MAG: DNA polymerase III subunit delta [Endomicrobia bacterium]|nr:DNA polymerase III subunit delta [Endomicrobiia bacterium]MCL2507001.1 DNA polymerase III subunit delta [Endomicrobiia bacterium]
MALLKIQDFNKHISSKKISPVYLFAGEEAYLIDYCLKKTESFLDAGDLNKEVFYAADSSSEDILNALQTLPFLSEKRVIVVKDLHKIKAADAERLSSYIDNPVDTSCLIMLYPSNYKKETISKRKSLINDAISSKICVSADCRKQYESEVKEFIRNEFTQKGKTASIGVISRIVDENGTDLLNISNEIEKLSLFAGKDKKNITEEDIEKISGYTKEINTYSLSSYIEAKDLKNAMFVLEKLFEEGEEPVMILSAIVSAVRRMLDAKSKIEEQKMSGQEAAASLRIHSFFAGPFLSNLKKHSLKNLKDSMKIMLKADTAIKTGTSDAVSALEKAILFVCR